MMHSWKYEVRLRQITPYICFESELHTLRATEVKPKLDRFLLWWQNPGKMRLAVTGKEERESLWNIARSLPQEWVLPKMNADSDPALRYKMRIVAEEGKKVTLSSGNQSLGAYFSADGSTASTKRASFYTKITLSILCFENELLKKIQEELPMFFAIQNFGFRQNKGFGSFMVEQRYNREGLVRGYLRKLNENCNDAQALLYILRLRKSTADYRLLLDMIANFNQRIKSGINAQTYIPSALLKNYVPHRYPEWLNDKKTMKLILQEKVEEKSNKGKLDIHQLSRNHEEKFNVKELYDENRKKKYVRGVLGFANQYTFRDVEWHGDVDVKGNVNFILESDKIKRFPNPLCFLPILEKSDQMNKCIILVSKRLLRRIQDQHIKFTIHQSLARVQAVHTNQRDSIAGERKDFANAIIKKSGQQLEFPDEFDLFDFFNYLVNQDREGSQVQIKNFGWYTLKKLEMVKWGEERD